MPTTEEVDLLTAHFKDGERCYTTIKITPPEGTSTTKLSLVALMDVSGSMGAAATVDRGGEQVDVGFSVLDITKHAMKTVIETMKEGDKLSVVAFSTAARMVSPLLPMTDANKAAAKQHVAEQVPSGCTNMWDALEKALDVLEEAAQGGLLADSIPSILFFTDGQPSEHLLPPNGILGSLKERMAKLTAFKPTIHTFGFGYDLDTPLLVEIATEGKGAFSFIPDSGFVGTVLVHAVANLKTCVGVHSNLQLTAQEGASIARVLGYVAPSGASVDISVDSVHHGQSKTVLVIMSGSDSAQCPVQVKLTYVNAAGAVSTAQAGAMTGAAPADFKKQLLRVAATELLMKILVNATDLGTSQQEVETFLTNWAPMSDDGVYQDIESQVKIAVSRPDYYKRWGANYVSSLMMAHRQQRCNNFKDKGVANYGGTLFEDQRDAADDIFTSMPPPVPSRVPSSAADSRTDPSSFSMSNFNDADNPCFHEDALVLLADGSSRACRDLRKGDVVAAQGGRAARVVCVVKTDCADGVQKMVTLPGGLRVTPWHPVRLPGSAPWSFPADLGETTEVACGAVYSVVLDAEHVVTIASWECVGLGHGLQEPVAQHDYYGTERVLRDLAGMPGFEEGLLHFRSRPVLRGNEGKTMGFTAATLHNIVRSDAN